MMAERSKTFLQAAGWGASKATAIAGDMSARRYFRVSTLDRTAILMEADTSMVPFVEMTDWLRAAGLSAPEIYAGAPETGLLLLEDFGSLSLNARLSQTPGTADLLYNDCTQLLLRIRGQEPPALPCPTSAELVDWTRLADQHYPGVRSDDLGPFRHCLERLLSQSLATQPTVSLRDFHGDNLMWLSDRDGVNRFGLLDYQDAFLTHPVYDLMSLLTDARMNVPRSRRLNVLAKYIARSGDAEGPLKCAFSAFSAQRNLRILGIFARAGRHLDRMSTVYDHFREALEHEAFAAIREQTLAAVPAPVGS